MTDGQTEWEKEEIRRREVARSTFLRYRSRARGHSRSSPHFPVGAWDNREGKGRSPHDSSVMSPQREEAGGPEEEGTAQSSWVAPPGTYRSKTGTGRSRWDPQPIGDILARESRERGWKRPLSLASVTVQWEDIVGPQVALHCPIESFEEGTLVARADSTAWAQQLQILLPHIHRRIDDKVGAGTVERVIVRAPEAPSWVYGRHHVKGRGPRDTYG